MNLWPSKNIRTLLFSLVVLVAGAASAASCSSDSTAELPMVDCAGTVPTFANVTIFSNVCTSCHSSTKSGVARKNAPVGLDFDTFTAAQPHAQKAVSEVYDGSMPPNGANANLTETQKQELYTWGLCGTPQ